MGIRVLLTFFIVLEPGYGSDALQEREDLLKKEITSLIYEKVDKINSKHMTVIINSKSVKNQKSVIDALEKIKSAITQTMYFRAPISPPKDLLGGSYRIFIVNDTVVSSISKRSSDLTLYISVNRNETPEEIIPLFSKDKKNEDAYKADLMRKTVNYMATIEKTLRTYCGYTGKEIAYDPPESMMQLELQLYFVYKTIYRVLYDMVIDKGYAIDASKFSEVRFTRSLEEARGEEVMTLPLYAPEGVLFENYIRERFLQASVETTNSKSSHDELSIINLEREIEDSVSERTPMRSEVKFDFFTLGGSDRASGTGSADYIEALKKIKKAVTTIKFFKEASVYRFVIGRAVIKSKAVSSKDLILTLMISTDSRESFEDLVPLLSRDPINESLDLKPKK